MAEFLIDHNHPECIGCGACAAILPDFWVMEGDKAHLEGSSKVGEHENLELATEDDFNKNKEAAESCPVNCIHILKDGEQVI